MARLVPDYPDVQPSSFHLMWLCRAKGFMDRWKPDDSYNEEVFGQIPVKVPRKHSRMNLQVLEESRGREKTLSNQKISVSGFTLEWPDAKRINTGLCYLILALIREIDQKTRPIFHVYEQNYKSTRQV